MKLQDVKMTDQMTGHENVGHEIAGHKRARYETGSAGHQWFDSLPGRYQVN